jgi:hypothetical protein
MLSGRGDTEGGERVDQALCQSCRGPGARGRGGRVAGIGSQSREPHVSCANGLELRGRRVATDAADGRNMECLNKVAAEGVSHIRRLSRPRCAQCRDTAGRWHG